MQIQVGTRSVGDGAPCFLIAEVGSNHNNDLDMALAHIDAAAEAGVDAVKFQAFRARDHYSRHTPTFGYLEGQDTYRLIESVEIDREWHQALMDRARKHGVQFFSSPCDQDAINQLDALGVPLWKVASFDLPDLDLVRSMASTGRPIILSTGMASMGDVERAVRACRAVGNDQVVLLQCTSLYPAPAHLSNLAAMDTLRRAFGTLVGYSDHTLGEHVGLAAVALGACMVEKHFTLDRSLPGPDHPFAIEPDELATMVAHVRDVEAALGDGRKDGPREEEREMFEKGRRSLHARRAVRAGQTLVAEDLVVKRPGLGIPPHLKDVVVGRTARTDIEEDAWITWDVL